MTVLQPYRFKHIGSFCLIFALAVFRPAAIWPEIPVSTAPLAVLAAWLLLLFKVYTTIGFIDFFTRHRILIALITVYFPLCGASLIANYHRYPDTAAFVRWGLTFPIIQSALVACGFLFTLPQNEKGLSLTRLPGSGLVVLAIATLIPVMAFWQIIDNKSAYEFYQYTVAGDIRASGNTRSIFAISTDLGAASAILSLSALLLGVYLVRTKQWLWVSAALAVFTLNAASGTLSGSRGFFLSIGVGLLVLTVQWLIHHRKLMVFSVVPLLLTAIMALQFAPAHVNAKLAKFAPFLKSLHQGTPVNFDDIKLEITAKSLGDRAILWQRAIEQTAEQPLLGISNGGYRLLNQSLGETPVNNVHNAFLQLGVDAGFGGILIGLTVLVLLVRRSQGSAQLTLLAAVSAGLLVDNFADHSLSWIALTSFALGNCALPMSPLPVGRSGKTQILAWLLAISLITSVVIFAQYQSKKTPKELSFPDLDRDKHVTMGYRSAQSLKPVNFFKWTTSPRCMALSGMPLS